MNLRDETAIFAAKIRCPRPPLHRGIVMRNITLCLCALAFVLAPLVGCATDSPQYADPPPGSHSPFAAPDERGTDDPLRSEPESDEVEEDETEQEQEPPAERE